MLQPSWPWSLVTWMLARKVASVVALTQGHLLLSTQEKTWDHGLLSTSPFVVAIGFKKPRAPNRPRWLWSLKSATGKPLRPRRVSAVRIPWALPGPMNLRWETSPVRIRLRWSNVTENAACVATGPQTASPSCRSPCGLRTLSYDNTWFLIPEFPVGRCRSSRRAEGFCFVFLSWSPQWFHVISWYIKCLHVPPTRMP